MLHARKPREQNGRDSFSRYRAQVRSAAIASLAILEGQNIDRIYCDLHDDFVVRRKDEDGFSYVFYQVKTKGKQNHNWSINEIFGLNARLKDQDKQSPEMIKKSFAGKLLLHTIVFSSHCESVVFQTNIHNSDEVDEVVAGVEKNNFSNKFIEVLVSKFNECYEQDIESELTEAEVKENLKKLKFETDVQYLKEKNNGFRPLVGEKIYEFSEVDLDRSELEEIILKLLDLIENKSSSIIEDLSPESVEEYAGVSIDDLLSVLSISKDAYYSLLKSGDNRAIKSASIIQRTLNKSGAGDEEIEYCSRCKTNWDLWFREQRHNILEIDLMAIANKTKTMFRDITRQGNNIEIASLKDPIESTKKELEQLGLLYGLDSDLLLGAFFSELVRGKS
ncbi:dsDNA nuclease domain-containing protein [Halomonas alkaliantarctica]|uniref:dsDNA nuclease domain-containing protein n=1 Tax=Halomonas alkaliantarctica TaxID=232346 RepID=UPI002657E7B9|nr:dsDNA nuclease domain-containing protein [Halomonas alkaliantarctica]